MKDFWRGFISQQRFFGSDLSAAEQTRSSWPRVIESYDSMPDIYNKYFDDLLRENNESFPYMVLAPARGGFLQKDIEKLICKYQDSICIIERRGSQTNAKKYPLDTIRDIEVGNILLDSWIKISGLTEDGLSMSSKVAYNSVGSGLLATIINKIRGIPNGGDSKSLIHEKAKFNYLEPLNFKFWNYARNSIFHGENVILSIFQPEFKYQGDRKPVWLFPASISPANLTILTDKELILIRDDEKPKDYKGVRYGGIWQYIPINNILAVSIREKESDQLILSIHLSYHGQLERQFSSLKKPDLMHLKGQIENLKTAG